MFFICSAQKIDAQVQNIREKQDTISATKSLEHIRPENIKKGPLNNALDVLSGQSAGVNVRLSLKPWGIALKFLFLHHENILFPND